VDVTVTTPAGSSAKTGTTCTQPGTGANPCDGFTYSAQHSTKLTLTVCAGATNADGDRERGGQDDQHGGSQSGQGCDCSGASGHEGDDHDNSQGGACGCSGSSGHREDEHGNADGQACGCSGGSGQDEDQRSGDQHATQCTILGAVLLDQITGKPISGELLIFTANPLGGGQPATATATTDSTGSAMAALRLHSGQYTFVVDFAGDKTYAASDASLEKAISTHTTGDGNVETGDVAEDAVIKVDNPAGYAPDPGHEAAGAAVEIGA
jgi:hypothetical protein